MNGDDIGHMIYLVVLGAAVLFWFVTNHRQSFGKTVQQALAWGLIFIGVITAVALWDDLRSAAIPVDAVFADQDRIEIPRHRDGHYYVRVDIDGTPVDFVVDTGASDLVLSRQDAERIGIDPESLAFIGRAMTANGEVRTAPVRLDDVRLGAFVDRNVSARVNGGAMEQSLLGMSYLQRYEQITITRGKLVLTR